MPLLLLLLTSTVYGQDVHVTEPDKKALLEANVLGCSPNNPCLFGLTKNRVAYIFSNPSVAATQLSSGSLLVAAAFITSSTPLYRRSALTKLAAELNCPRVKLDKQNNPIPPPEDQPHCHITYHFGINGHGTMVQVLLHDPSKSIEDGPPDHAFWVIHADETVRREQCICHLPI